MTVPPRQAQTRGKFYERRGRINRGILRPVKRQGAVVAFAPSGYGLRVETWDAIRARRNVRNCSGQTIAAEHLGQILEAGRRSP